MVSDMTGVARTVKDAKEVLCGLGAPGQAVAGRLGRASERRNAAAHPAYAGLAAAAGQVLADADMQVERKAEQANVSEQAVATTPKAREKLQQAEQMARNTEEMLKRAEEAMQQAERNVQLPEEKAMQESKNANGLAKQAEERSEAVRCLVS
ncbi:unnamed protein product [Prorocentrum cordatum]|uniref:V-type proton ATPase subunit G n=1 Tax=Prorocentrum cordatum TaxID=2364126 RepID=A0ABN9QLC9_9DINO|nr:unnamed protein product [Polarella glacialis]